MANEDTMIQVLEMYRRMSLLELLAEENTLTTLLRKKTFDSVRKRVREILRSEVERKLL